MVEYVFILAATVESVHTQVLRKSVIHNKVTIIPTVVTYVLGLHPVRQASCTLVGFGQLCTTFCLPDHIMGRLYYELKILIR